MANETFSAHDYRIGFSDFNAFYGAWLKRNYFTFSKLVMTVIYAAVLLILPWKGDNGGHLGGAHIVTALLFAGLLVFVIMPLATYVVGAVSFGAGDSKKKVHAIIIDAAGVHKSSDNTQIITTWSEIYAVDVTKTTILLFTNRKCAIMVPKAAFATLEGAATFADKAKQFWAASRGGS